MFSLFRRKPDEKPAEVTFKTRVKRFWEWYAGEAERIYRNIEDKESENLAPEIGARIDEIIPGFAWVFGPGADSKGHSFTLSGEGNEHKMLLTAFWATQAPKLAGWTFYSSRQPSRHPDRIRLDIGEMKFEGTAFWLTPSVHVKRKSIDLTAWHPLFPKLDEKTRWTVLGLLLDEALGEVGTENWINKVEISDTNLTGAIPLSELRSFTERVQAEYAWKKGAPGEIWSLYRFEEQDHEKPRGDIYVGTTSAMALIRDFAAAQGQLKDPLAGTGADYVYVAFDARILPKGKEADRRGQFEDVLHAALESAASGRVLGGAMGRRFVYVDLLLYDGAVSLRLVLDTLRGLRLPAGTSVNYFAHEKRGHRVVL